jgi:hypothetical protein
MRISTEDWRKIQKAIEDGNLIDLINDMLDEAYEAGKRDGYEVGKNERT